MGWAVGFDPNWRRDIGYGVPALCDHPGCGKRIDRGLSYVCGGEPFGGEEGCGLYFCSDHLDYGHERQMCERCLASAPPFEPTSDVDEWSRHKLDDPTWSGWRDENPEEVERLRAALRLDTYLRGSNPDHKLTRGPDTQHGPRVSTTTMPTPG